MTQLLTDAGWWGKNEVVDPGTGEVVETVFDARRLRVIYDTNVRQAHSAGRWQRILDSEESHPYLRYVTKGDDRVREAHAAWEGVCLPVRDPWWRTHYPLNGWGDRCRVIAVSTAELDRLLAAGRIRTSAPEEQTVSWTNKWTGETHEIPAGIDPGFAYNVGDAAARAKALADAQRTKRARAGAGIAAADEAAT